VSQGDQLISVHPSMRTFPQDEGLLSVLKSCAQWCSPFWSRPISEGAYWFEPFPELDYLPLDSWEAVMSL